MDDQLQRCFRQEETSSADHSGRAVYGMNRLRPLEQWDRGLESHSRYECLCDFILCLCCSKYR
jgi:hypothetical protein